MILSRDFYAQNARSVARALLGARLVRRVNGEQVVGRIVETEAYTGLDDQASHAYPRKTPRNLPMYEAPGFAYVYLIYGRYWLLNTVCEPAEHPAAVLLRAIEPLEGHAFIARQRAPHPPRNWTNGPARLTLALAVGGAFNRLDLTTPAGGLWIEAGEAIPDAQVRTGARVGMGKNLPEPWYSMPWRWWVADNRHV